SGWVCSGAPSNCHTICGDGLVRGDEQCDDHGSSSGDGCSSVCTTESGYTCTGQPSVCTAICGDGVLSGTEACDDGGLAAGDGCSPARPGRTGLGREQKPQRCD